MASIIKVDNVQNTAAGKNIIKEVGNTVTIGASGDTVALAAGASQTGFGQTYSAVAWDTTAKTTTVTGVAGVGYFINTSGAAVTANLPAGVAGDVIAFSDYTRTFQTNNLTITPNGAEKIGGVAAIFLAATEGQSITLVYVDATEGWINTGESTGQAGLLPAFITATGGTIATVDTDYKVHTFTGPGTFTVSDAGNPLGSNTVDYMVGAGGGGGGDGSGGASVSGGGAGGGGYRESPGTASGSYTVSPLGVAPAVALPVAIAGYPVTVGGGGTTNQNGNNSVFAGTTTITSAGGGAGGQGSSSPIAGAAGGSGGGGNGSSGGAGSGNTPPVNPAQGSNGGSGATNGGSGGGGATAVGANGGGGAGGAGATSSINGTPTTRSLGATGAAPGGGGGAGSPQPANSGNGGPGGQYSGAAGGTGGSGLVIIRYKFQ